MHQGFHRTRRIAGFVFLAVALALTACGSNGNNGNNNNGNTGLQSNGPSDPNYWAQFANPGASGGTTTLSPISDSNGGTGGSSGGSGGLGGLGGMLTDNSQTPATSDQLQQLENAMNQAAMMLRSPQAQGTFGPDIGQVLGLIAAIEGLGKHLEERAQFVGALLHMLATGNCMTLVKKQHRQAAAAAAQGQPPGPHPPMTLAQCIGMSLAKVMPLVPMIAQNLGDQGLQMLEGTALHSLLQPH